MLRGLMLVNLAAAACADPQQATPASAASAAPWQAPAAATEPWTRLSRPLSTLPQVEINAGALSTLDLGPSSWLADDDNVIDALTAPLGRGQFVTEGLGAALEEALEEADELGRNPRRYTVATLTLEKAMGSAFSAGVCENPQVSTTVDGEDGDWELRFGLQAYTHLLAPPEPYWTTLPEACQEGLLETGGDIEAAVDAGACAHWEAAGFFAEGSECRLCVEESAGDYAACLESGACQEEMPETTWSVVNGENVYYQLAGSHILACAPDYGISVLIGVTIAADGSMPEPYDHAGWEQLCIPFWDEEIDDFSYYCWDGRSTLTEGETLGQGVHGMVVSLHPEGETGDHYRHRSMFTPRITVDGYELRYGWEWAHGRAVLSHPTDCPDMNEDGVVDAQDPFMGLPCVGWGLNPLALRPDGTDPTQLDHTYARDWLAASVLKTATTRTGVPIQMSNQSRCAEWQALDDGTHRCLSLGVPEAGWLYDAVNSWWETDQGNTIALPVATLASTGAADPDIPGEVIPFVASSPTLADPEFDDCSWPATFTPDQVPFPDHPGDWTGPVSLWGDGWRFDKEDAEDMRLVLYTNVARNFCPDGIEEAR